MTLCGLELGILTMRKGEFSRFLFLPEYAYGAMGCPPLIPPVATVLYEVQVLDFLDSAEVDEFFAMSPVRTLGAFYLVRAVSLKVGGDNLQDQGIFL